MFLNKGIASTLCPPAGNHNVCKHETRKLISQTEGVVSRQTPAVLSRKLVRRIANEGTRPNEVRDTSFRKRIRSIPKGKVATYGQVAAAAGYPLYHRAVARLLRTIPADSLPWHRVVGSGGEIKLQFEAGAEQRLRLKLEGVQFRGRKVDLSAHQHTFGAWDPEDGLP